MVIPTTATTTTVKYNLVLLGGSRVGKKSFIHAAEQMFQKEAQLQLNNYSLLSDIHGLNHVDLVSQDSSTTTTTTTNTNTTNTNTTRNNKRLSLSESFHNAGKRLSVTLKNSLGGGGGNSGLSPSNGNSPPQQHMSNMVIEDLRQQISDYFIDNNNGETQQQQLVEGITPPNTITVVKDHIKYELHVTSFYDTGFTEEEQAEVAKADGYFIMIDLTNKFSIQRAKMFHRKLHQMCNPNHVPSNSSSFFDNKKTTSNNNDNAQQDGTGDGNNSNNNNNSNNMNNNNNNENSATTTTGSGDSSESSPSSLKLPLILIGSKSDEQPQRKRQISTLEGIRLADSWNCQFMECSVMQAHNKGIDSAIRQIINMIEQKKKRASRAFKDGPNSPRNKRFSWRKSLSLGTGGGLFGLTPFEEIDPANNKIDAVGPRSSPRSTEAAASDSPNNGANNGRRVPMRSNASRSSAASDSTRRHSIAFGKIPSFKGLKAKLGLHRREGSNPSSQPPSPISSEVADVDRNSRRLSAPTRGASDENITNTTQTKKKWYKRNK